MFLNPGSVQEFTDHLTVNGASPNTVRAYRSDLMAFLIWDNCRQAQLADSNQLENLVAKYITIHRPTWSVHTTNRKLSAFRSWAKWVGYSNFLANYNPPKPAPGIAHPIPEGIKGILDMIDATDNPVYKALVALGGLAGLRVSETRAVRRHHIRIAPDEITVYGKGAKMRVVPISVAAWIAISPRWLQIFHTTDYMVPLSDAQARKVIRALGRKAGLNQPVSSHDLRMTFGTAAYYKSGGDLRAVQQLLGHASSHTTENYTQVTMEAMRKAAEIV